MRYKVILRTREQNPQIQTMAEAKTKTEVLHKIEQVAKEIRNEFPAVTYGSFINDDPKCEIYEKMYVWSEYESAIKGVIYGELYAIRVH